MLDKTLLNYIKGKRKYIFFIVLFNIVSLILNVAITFSFVFLVKNIILREHVISLLYFVSIIVLALLRIFSSKATSVLSNKLADYVVYKLRDETYNKFLRIHGKSPFSVQEMAQLSTEGIEQLRLYYFSYIPSFFYAMVAPLLLFIMIMFINVPVAIIYLICVPLIPMSIVIVSKWAKKIFNKYWDQYTSLGNSFLDNVNGMKELKIFTFDNVKEKQMMSESESFRKITMKVLTMQLASITIMDLVAYGGAGIGIVFSLIGMKNGVDVYLTLFIILIGAEFFLPMRSLGSAFHTAMNGATAGKKVIKLLNESDYIEGNSEVDGINNIKLKDVTFGYSEKNILSNLNLELKVGFNSLVGLSGSGKSTISKLCAKMEKVDNGCILVDGINVNDVLSKSYYKKVCYISNNSYLFHQTIRESFKFYNSKLTDREMVALLNEMRLGHLSLDLKVNDQNSNISGGEKQRLVLAFYLSKEFDFYIFDEATSNIDAESEEIILSKIFDLSKTKIILFISHRLKNVVNSNVIYYLKDGSIVEKGTFDELIEKKGNFYNVYNFQVNLESVGYYEEA